MPICIPDTTVESQIMTNSDLLVSGFGDTGLYELRFRLDRFVSSIEIRV